MLSHLGSWMGIECIRIGWKETWKHEVTFGGGLLGDVYNI